MPLGLAMPQRRQPKTNSPRSTWTDVRPKSRPRMAQVAPPPAVEGFVEWGASFGNPKRASMLVLPGDLGHREQFLRCYMGPEYDAFRPDCVEDLLGPDTRTWVSEGILPNITRRFARLPITVRAPKQLSALAPSTWPLIWSLITSEEFLVEEPLRELVDQEFRLVHSVYRALWEARFLARETLSPVEVRQFVDRMTRWITNETLDDQDVTVLSALGIRKPVVYPTERFDVLLFLLALAEQNALVNRALLVFDGLEMVLRADCRPMLRQLDALLDSVDRWVRLGCPVGIVLGFDASKANMTSLKRLNPKLHARVDAGLEWTR